MSDEGGGASKSTDPAAGSSAATDISLREFEARETYWLDRLISQENVWLDRHMTSEVAALRRETEAANKNAETAIAVASVEAKERLDQHNGLIQKMESQSATFVSREVLDEFRVGNDNRISRVERLLFMAMGGIFIVGLIGISNLVKVWG